MNFTAVNTEELKKSQANALENAAETERQFGQANAGFQEHIGNSGDGAMGGRLGEFIGNKWVDETTDLISKYKEDANRLLNESLSGVIKNDNALVDETTSMYN